jgi:hypothetical protein
MTISLEGCTTTEEAIARVTTLIDRVQADAERRLLSSLLLRDEDPDVIDQALEGAAEWNREQREAALRQLRDLLTRC